MEEFIRVLTEQIRCVKARDGVAKEYIDHINDQAECFEDGGMSHEDAIQAAVKEMGDPVSIGMELDHIHRPKTDWKMLFMVVIFSIAGIVIQYVTGVLDVSQDRIGYQCLYTVIGLLAMFGIYYLDYSFIGKHPKLIYWGLFVVYFIYTNLWAETINGQARDMIMPSYLFIPVYAGVLYQYRGQRYSAIVKSILYMILPICFSYCFIPSLPTSCNLLFIMYGMLLLAIWKGWFRIDSKKVLVLLFLGVVFPFLSALFGYHFIMHEFQKLRVQSFFHSFGGVGETSYIYSLIRSLIADSKWLGFTANVEQETALTQDCGLVITQLITSYGLVIGLIVMLALFMLVSHMFHITWKQRNQLGFMIGAGCGLIFIVMIMEGIFMNLGLFPCTPIHIPFLTYGGSATIFYDILLGLLLSVYRYQNVVSDKSFRPKWKISLKVEKAMKE